MASNTKKGKFYICVLSAYYEKRLNIPGLNYSPFLTFS